MKARKGRSLKIEGVMAHAIVKLSYYWKHDAFSQYVMSFCSQAVQHIMLPKKPQSNHAFSDTKNKNPVTFYILFGIV